jgi:Zn-dependent protease
MKGQRDPRAWWIDEDPFETRKKSNHHSSARDDGKWRQQRVQVMRVSENGSLVTNIFGDNSNMHSISMHKGSIWHFSSTEIRDLGLATGAFTIALALMFDGGLMGISANFPIFCIYSLISLAPAFILHEFAHKFVARYYGCWAEFRADRGGLRFGLILAAILGVVFMAPGAVMVAGNATRDQFGKIAVAGPVTNMLLWTAGFFAWLILGGLFSPIDVVIGYWLWGNSFLCAFNMLPFGPLDGRKIKTWSEPIFYTCLSVAVAMVYVTWTSTSI